MSFRALSRQVSLSSSVRRTTAISTPARPAAVVYASQPSTRWYASSPTPNSFPQLPPGFEKLAHSPQAMSAISTLIEVMKKNGVDLHSGEKPSMWQMVKLARNDEVRKATMKVMEELKNAGIDVSPERLQSIMNSSGDLFNKNGDKK